MVPSRVMFGTPAADCWVGALKGVMAELLTVAALSGWAKAEAALKAECGGEG